MTSVISCLPARPGGHCWTLIGGQNTSRLTSCRHQVQSAIVGMSSSPLYGGAAGNLGRQHLQRYLDEIVWRWNHRDPVREVVKQWTKKAGIEREKSTTNWKPIPVVDQMRVLLHGTVGKQLRRSEEYGLCWP